MKVDTLMVIVFTSCFRGMTLTILLLCVLTSLGWTQQKGARPVATIQSLTGAVTYQRAKSSRFVNAVVRDPLYVGDLIGTDAKGKAALLFNDGSQARLAPASAIRITAPVSVGKGQTTLFAAVTGEVWARMRPGKAAQTKAALAAVRGTEFLLKVGEHDVATLTVLSGEVEFSNSFGSVVVAESQQSMARTDAAPTPPVTIDNAGFIVEWTLELDRAIIPVEHQFLDLRGAALTRELTARRERASAHPDDAEDLTALGEALFDARRYAEARDAFLRAEKLAPDRAAIAVRLGYSLLTLGQTGEGISRLRAFPADGDAATVLALALLQENRPREAEVTARQALAIAPTSRAFVALGLALMRQPAQIAPAIDAFQTALRQQPAAAHYQAQAWLALALQAQNNPDAALTAAREAVRLCPDSALAHGNLALVYLFSGRAFDAMNAAQAALRANSDSVAARCVLGQAMLAQGDVDEAAFQLARAVALDPGLSEAHYLLGIADAQRRDYHEATGEFQACLRLAPDFLPAVTMQARVLIRMGRVKQAVALAKDLLARAADRPDVCAALGAIYHEQGDYPAALAQYRRAIALNPQSAYYYAEMARILDDANQLNAATRAAQQAVALAPEVAAYHAELGAFYYNLGLNARATYEYQTALRLDPQNARARADLALITDNPDAKYASLTQAYLQDPTLPEHWLRTGRSLSGSAIAGNSAYGDTWLQGRFDGLNKRLQGYSELWITRDDGQPGRANAEYKNVGISQDITLVADPRTNVHATVYTGYSTQGLPGLVSNPYGDDLDDSYEFRGAFASLAARRRVGYGQYWWAGFEGAKYRERTNNPDLQSLPYDDTGRYTLKDQWYTLGVRRDIQLRANPANYTSLTLGIARDQANYSELYEKLVIPDVRAKDEGYNYLVGYAQLFRRIGQQWQIIPHLNVAVGKSEYGVNSVRKEHFVSLHPSLLLAYQPDARTILRGIYLRSPGFSIRSFLPMEAQLLIEPGVRANATVDFRGNEELAEIDFERHPTTDRTLKLFLFGARISKATISPGYVSASSPYYSAAKLRRYGVGGRIEERLTPTLLASLVMIGSRTTAVAPGEVFDGFTAPYQPLFTSQLSLIYVTPTNTALALTVTHNGDFFQDSPVVTAPTRPLFPAQTYADLWYTRMLTSDVQCFAYVNNLFDTPAIAFRDVPSGWRTFGAGVRFWR